MTTTPTRDEPSRTLLTDEQLMRVARALADPRRFEVLEVIARATPSGGTSCSDLAERLPISQPTVSHHTKELAAANLITLRPEGRFSFFTLNAPVLAAYLHAVSNRLIPRHPSVLID